MKILLFGKDCQVGWELQRSLAPLGEIVALDFGSREFCGDFTRLDGIADTVRAVAPDVIVNAAAKPAAAAYDMNLIMLSLEGWSWRSAGKPDPRWRPLLHRWASVSAAQ